MRSGHSSPWLFVFVSASPVNTGWPLYRNLGHCVTWRCCTQPAPRKLQNFPAVAALLACAVVRDLVATAIHTCFRCPKASMRQLSRWLGRS